MNTCPNTTKCSFYQAHATNLKKDPATEQIIQTFCNTENCTKCVRNKISERLGDSFVPTNMKPDGNAVVGTNNTFWSTGVKLIVQEN